MHAQGLEWPGKAMGMHYGAEACCSSMSPPEPCTLNPES